MRYINIPDNLMIDIDMIKNYPPEKVVLITTGSQGEAMAALSRMAGGIHKKVSIMPGDTVILSSSPIPGNEKHVSKIINELSRMGARIKVEGNSAVINGIEGYTGANLVAPDLRAGAALVIAALAAEGFSTVDDIKYILRGYEDFDGKIRALGGQIQVVDSDKEL
jgi:hypothetical protein